MRSLLLLPLLALVPSGCSQNPHVDIASQAQKVSANATQTPRSGSLPKPVPTDRDGDGINDNDDKCPDVPGVIAYQGCPAQPPAPQDPEEEPTAPSEPDADGDFVPDSVDRCPYVPGQIFNDGCPIDPPLPDRDGDGVPDIYDRCPEVPGQIFLDGCPLEGPRKPFPPQDGGRCPYPHGEDEERRVLLLVKESLKFDFDRSVIKAESFPALRRLVGFLRKYPAAHLYMVGHADDRGTFAYNQALSSARVFAVKDFLVKEGISPYRISADARGKLEPLVSVDGKEGAALDWARAMNRRVDMSVRYELSR